MAEIRTLNDIKAIEQIPLSERGLPANTYEMLQQGAALNPDGTALAFFLQGTAYAQAVQFSYKELIRQITQTANLFHSLGVGKEDVVSLVLPNLPETVFCIWGGEAAGIINPINPLLEPDHIAEIMNAAGAKVLVTLAPFPKTDLWDKVEMIRHRVPSLETILQIDLAQYLTGPKRLIVKLVGLRIGRPRPQDGQSVLNFHNRLATCPADSLQSKRQIQPDDIAAYFHTGGTTGTPKIAYHTHFNEVFDAWTSEQTLPVGPGTVAFCGLPLFHVNAVIITHLAPFSRGATVILGSPQGYRGEGVIPNFWKIVEHFKVNIFSGVPTVYSTLLDVPIGDNDISSLEFALCGASPMPVEVFHTFEERTGIRILEGYGLTEGTCVSSVNPAYGERRVGSIGYHLPYQDMKTVILDEEGVYQRDCEPDEVGVVIIRGPNVFPGFKQGHYNRDIWLDTGDEGGPWLNTGDLGRMDEDGYFWLTGRQKELIIRGGHNIDPALIEDPLHDHPAVALAAAVGRPDSRVGELPVAYVQLKPDASATPDELLQFATEHIGERAAVPKAIRIIDQMPLTTVGKIFKPQLRWLEIQDVFSDKVGQIDGIEAVNVEAGSDPRHGTLARLQITAAAGADPAKLKASVSQVLGRYAIAYEVEMS